MKAAVAQQKENGSYISKWVQQLYRKKTEAANKHLSTSAEMGRYIVASYLTPPVLFLIVFLSPFLWIVENYQVESDISQSSQKTSALGEFKNFNNHFISLFKF